MTFPPFDAVTLKYLPQPVSYEASIVVNAEKSRKLPSPVTDHVRLTELLAVNVVSFENFITPPLFTVNGVFDNSVQLAKSNVTPLTVIVQFVIDATLLALNGVAIVNVELLIDVIFPESKLVKPTKLETVTFSSFVTSIPTLIVPSLLVETFI